MERALDAIDTMIDFIYFVGSCVLLLILLPCLASAPARGQQEHQHGENGIPNWYDTDCCTMKDCRPVKDETIEFGIGPTGAPVVFYTEPERAGQHRGEKKRVLEYEKSRWRQSKDERYHVCHNDLTVYCVYLRAGA